MLHDSESHSIVSSLKVVAGAAQHTDTAVAAAAATSTGTEAARVKRTDRLVQLIRVLLARLQKQRSRAIAEFKSFRKNCKADTSADRTYVRRKLSHVRRLRELLVIERATYVRMRDEAEEMNAEVCITFIA